MAEKHYNADYLNETAKILKEIKLNSYKPFISIASGNIADIGCGTGADVINMAKVLNPNTTIWGIDHDSDLIAIARNDTQSISNVDFKISDVEHLPFENESLDGIRAERLVQHLKNANVVFQEIYRALKPSSKVVIVETDWSSLSFYNGDLSIANKIVEYLTNQKINNGYASKKIISYFNDNGFVNNKIEIYTLIAKDLSDVFTYLWIDKIIAEMEQKGILLKEEADNFISELNKANQQNSFICSLNIVVCIAEKP